MVLSAPPDLDGADFDRGCSHSVSSGVCAVPDRTVSPCTVIHSAVSHHTCTSPSGCHLESEQENPSSSRPKTSDPDSPETHPTPRTLSPITLSKPPMMPMKPEEMPSKMPDATPKKPEATPTKPEATPMKPETTPSKASDDSLKPPAMPRKCTLTPQKAIPGSSGDSTKDILDCIATKYGSGMSPQYSNVLALLTSGKSSQVTAPKRTDPNAMEGGDHAYIKPMRSDSDSDRKKAEPPNKKAKCDPVSGPEVTDTGSRSSKKKSKKSPKKIPKSKKTITSDSNSSESENLCGKLHSQPTKEGIEKHQCWRTKKWASDLPGIHSYLQRKGIIPESPPPHDFRDHSNYIWQMLHNNDSSSLSIYLLANLLKQYSKDTSSTGRK